MIVDRVKLKDFRSYESLTLDLPRGMTVVTGENGAGKTNLLESIYMGSVGRSCRTNSDTRVVGFGSSVARVEISGSSPDAQHELSVGVARGRRRALSADGVAVSSFDDIAWRPLVAVFMPDRLELIKGPPGIRRGHFDQFVNALWPARRENRRDYVAALAQRNALVARGDIVSRQLDAWEAQLAKCGAQLVHDRRQMVEQIGHRVTASAQKLSLSGELTLDYRPSIDAGDEESIADAMREGRQDDVRRGYTTAGPHRDNFVFSLSGHDLRKFGSQGQQRTSLLALLLAESETLAELTGRAPLVLLDDVMSELDAPRRIGLLEHVRPLAQCVVTTTDLAHVPDLDAIDLALTVENGTVKRS